MKKGLMPYWKNKRRRLATAFKRNPINEEDINDLKGIIRKKNK